jgi:hypothetical protein
VRTVFYVFGLSRLIVLAVIVIGGQVVHEVVGSDEATRHVSLSLRQISIARVVRERVKVADVNWYQTIAVGGYEKIPYDGANQHNWAFFPVFPLIWRAASAITGESVFTGVWLSNLLFLLALFAVYTAARDFGLDEPAAETALLYVAAFPTSYFFSLPMTESLFLLLVAGSFVAARRDMWWLAGILGGIASGTRFVGIVLLPALVMFYFQTRAHARRRWSFLWLGLTPLGLLAYMCYLHAITGNALAFRASEVAWGRKAGFFTTPLFEYLRHPLIVFAPWNFRVLNFLAPTVALVCGGLLVKRRQWGYAAFTVLIVVAALSSSLLQSQARYAMVVFPVYFVVADFMKTRPRLDFALRALSIALLALMTALFVARFTLAMA